MGRANFRVSSYLRLVVLSLGFQHVAKSRISRESPVVQKVCMHWLAFVRACFDFYTVGIGCFGSHYYCDAPITPDRQASLRHGGEYLFLRETSFLIGMVIGPLPIRRFCSSFPSPGAFKYASCLQTIPILFIIVPTA
jgi:hypothetical protein